MAFRAIDAIVFSDATIVTAERVFPGHVVEGGRIAEIAEGRRSRGDVDCQGDYLLPRLVELHTDHLEAHYTPRPKVGWRAGSAVIAYDAQIVSAGITTVFDSFRIGMDCYEERDSVGEQAAIVGDTIEQARAAGLLRAERRAAGRIRATPRRGSSPRRGCSTFFPPITRRRAADGRLSPCERARRRRLARRDPAGREEPRGSRGAFRSRRNRDRLARGPRARLRASERTGRAPRSGARAAGSRVRSSDGLGRIRRPLRLERLHSQEARAAVFSSPSSGPAARARMR